MSLLIKGGTVVNAHMTFKADVLCKDGIIAEIAESIQPPAGVRVVDAKGKLIIPGGIDPHTHLQLPFMGTVAVDDFYYGTRAAVAGGTTMLIDFCIPGKGASLVEAYHKWRSWADPKVLCDYGLHVAITWFDKEGKVAQEMGEVVRRFGVASFKMFMAYKGVFMLDDGELMEAFKQCKKNGALAQVHAENGDAIDVAVKRLLEKGCTGPEAHALARPEDVEAEATYRAIMLADQVKAPLYVVHVMSKPACDAVIRGRNEGKVCFGEPIAAGLGVDNRMYHHKNWRHAAAYVMSPPLRDPTTKHYLMRHLATGNLQTVGTDNCTFNGNQKAMGKDNFAKIPNGVNGLQDRLSVVWTKGVHAGVLTPEQFVAVTSTNVAKLFGCFPKKGIIRVGSDADIVIWDPQSTRTISAKTHFHGCDFNIFEGMKVYGNPFMTIVRGVVAFENNRIMVPKGFGKYVPRKAFASAYDAIPQLEAVQKQNEQPIKRAPYTGPVFDPKAKM